MPKMHNASPKTMMRHCRKSNLHTSGVERRKPLMREEYSKRLYFSKLSLVPRGKRGISGAYCCARKCATPDKDCFKIERRTTTHNFINNVRKAHDNRVGTIPVKDSLVEISSGPLPGGGVCFTGRPSRKLLKMFSGYFCTANSACTKNIATAIRAMRKCVRKCVLHPENSRFI